MMEPEPRLVRIHGHEVGYRQTGDGPVLLLIHGIAGSSRTWSDVFPLLARRFTVVAPDLTGHGESAKPAGDYSLGAYASGLRDLLAVLGIDRVTLVGHSLGGGIAMQLAYQYPECCERLVLVDSGGLGREVGLLLRLLSVPGAEMVMPLVFQPFVRNWGDAVARFLRDQGLRSARASETWRAYGSLTEAENRAAFARTIRSVITPAGQAVSATDRLYLAERLPTLIVWGDRDGIIPVSHAHAAHAAIPGSRLQIIEGASHYPHLEEPVRFVDALLDFVEGTEPAVLDRQELTEVLRSRSRVADAAG